MTSTAPMHSHAQGLFLWEGAAPMQFNKDHIICNMHDFKNNLSRLTRYLEQGAYTAVFVTRYERVVGAYMTQGAEDIARSFTQRAKKEGRNPVSAYEDDVFRDK